MYILGISAFYHDSAAALIKNGEIIAAVQEERFTRIKNDESFPINSINYCLKEAGIKVSDLEYIAFYEDTHLKFNRILNSYINKENNVEKHDVNKHNFVELKDMSKLKSRSKSSPKKSLSLGSIDSLSPLE